MYLTVSLAIFNYKFRKSSFFICMQLPHISTSEKASHGTATLIYLCIFSNTANFALKDVASCGEVLEPGPVLSPSRSTSARLSSAVKVSQSSRSKRWGRTAKSIM